MLLMFELIESDCRITEKFSFTEVSLPQLLKPFNVLGISFHLNILETTRISPVNNGSTNFMCLRLAPPKEDEAFIEHYETSLIQIT